MNCNLKSSLPRGTAAAPAVLASLAIFLVGFQLGGGAPSREGAQTDGRAVASAQTLTAIRLNLLDQSTCETSTGLECLPRSPLVRQLDDEGEGCTC
ncbi:hypothetical protein [Ramlibacter tataouinensis]|uniref:hypothetical protein n=1 Tax=Ramlibacter tataouinensis TaxID=94132 RepID=UPI0011AE6B7F|nr:hypothetical protein [Ramlibacter tataouinensis]